LYSQGHIIDSFEISKTTMDSTAGQYGSPFRNNGINVPRVPRISDVFFPQSTENEDTIAITPRGEATTTTNSGSARTNNPVTPGGGGEAITTTNNSSTTSSRASDLAITPRGEATTTTNSGSARTNNPVNLLISKGKYKETIALTHLIT
jgi:flagellar hook-length control protein FliK